MYLCRADMNLIQLWNKEEKCNIFEVGENVCLSWQRTAHLILQSVLPIEKQTGRNHIHYYQ